MAVDDEIQVYDKSTGLNLKTTLSALRGAASSAFLAYNSATDANVTGDGTTFDVEFDSERFDVGSSFASSVFTAPATGYYAFSTTVGLTGLVVGNVIDFRLVTTARSYSLFYGTAAALAAPGDLNLNCTVAAADMTAGDTAKITVTVSGGAKVVDVFGTNGQNTHFCGHRVG